MRMHPVRASEHINKSAHSAGECDGFLFGPVLIVGAHACGAKIPALKRIVDALCSAMHCDR